MGRQIRHMEPVQDEEDYVDIDDLEEYADDGPMASDIEDMDDDDEDLLPDALEQEQEQEQEHMDEDVVDEAETVFTGHADAVYAVCVSAARPELVATAGGDDVGRIWNANNGECIAVLSGHTDSVACVSFNHDGTLLGTGGLEGMVKIWKVEDGTLVQSLEGPGEDVTWIEWHSKGNVILA